MDNIIELVLASRSGSEESFVKLCETYSALLYSMSHKYSAMCANDCGVGEDDFLQEAKIALYNAVNTFSTENSNVTFGAYAKVCIRNRLISCVRRAKSKKRMAGASNKPTYESPTVQDAVIWRELEKKLLLKANTDLSAFEKKVFSMYLAGMKAKEISKKIGKDEKSINNAIYRVRLKLKTTVD